MEEEQVREALKAHWHASAVGDANAEYDIYDDNAICDYPFKLVGTLGLRREQETLSPIIGERAVASRNVF